MGATRGDSLARPAEFRGFLAAANYTRGQLLNIFVPFLVDSALVISFRTGRREKKTTTLRFSEGIADNVLLLDPRSIVISSDANRWITSKELSLKNTRRSEQLDL